MTVFLGKNLKLGKATKQADHTEISTPVQPFSGRIRRIILQSFAFSVFRISAVINGIALFIIVYFMPDDGIMNLFIYFPI